MAAGADGPLSRCHRWPTEKPDPRAYILKGDGDRIKVREREIASS